MLPPPAWRVLNSRCSGLISTHTQLRAAEDPNPHCTHVTKMNAFLRSPSPIISQSPDGSMYWFGGQKGQIKKVSKNSKARSLREDSQQRQAPPPSRLFSFFCTGRAQAPVPTPAKEAQAQASAAGSPARRQYRTAGMCGHHQPLSLTKFAVCSTINQSIQTSKNNYHTSEGTLALVLWRSTNRRNCPTALFFFETW